MPNVSAHIVPLLCHSFIDGGAGIQNHNVRAMQEMRKRMGMYRWGRVTGRSGVGKGGDALAVPRGTEKGILAIETTIQVRSTRRSKEKR